MQLAVFLVEDNAEARANLVGALEELTGARVLAASATEEDALAWLARNAAAWDLLIADLFLNEGSGLQVLRRVRRARPGQKVVVFSNYVNPDLRKYCAQIGVDAVFDKSTEIDALVDYCSQCCSLQAQAAVADPIPPGGIE